MAPLSGNLIQTAVTAGQNNVVSAKQQRIATPQKVVFFNLEVIDDFSTALEGFPDQEEIQTIRHGKRYRVIASSSGAREHAKQQRVQLRSSIELQLKCTEASILIEDEQCSIAFEEAEGFEHEFEIQVPDECPTCKTRFVLYWPERRTYVASLEVNVEGTYNLADEQLAGVTKIELDAALPEQTAILHIFAASSDKLAMKGWSRRGEKLQIEMPSWEPVKLGEFVEREIRPEDVIASVRRFSRSQVGNLIGWLKKLLAKYGEQLNLVIDDHTDLETPWEMVEVSDEQYLGALAIVVRWTQVRCFDDFRTLKMCDVWKQGSVITYLDDEELGARQTYREREALKGLKGRGCSDLRELRQQLLHLELQHDVGLIYLGCHGYEGMAVGAQHAAAERITYLNLEIPRVHLDPRPIVFVNACDSARLRRDGKEYFKGLLEVLLARFASGYIGTLGRVGSTYASTVAERLLRDASNKAGGIQIAEVLRQLRAEAVREIAEEKLEILSEEEKRKREAQFLFAFMYVYYGNALVRLQLIKAGEMEVER